MLELADTVREVEFETQNLEQNIQSPKVRDDFLDIARWLSFVQYLVSISLGSLAAAFLFPLISDLQLS